MPTYVDEPRVQREHGLSGHLIGDPIDDVHALAAALGLGESLWSPDSPVPHYQLPADQRAAAIAAGAIALRPEEWDSCLARIREAVLRARCRDIPQPSRPARRATQPAQGRLFEDSYG